MSNIKIFESKKVRTHWDEETETWYFSVIDVIEILTDSANARDYWFKMKKRVKTEDGLELSTICRQLKMEASDGKMRETDVADTQSLLRIIQSIPSPKAEPFKQWLAKTGYERMQEIQDPVNLLFSTKSYTERHKALQTGNQLFLPPYIAPGSFKMMSWSGSGSLLQCPHC